MSDVLKQGRKFFGNLKDEAFQEALGKLTSNDRESLFKLTEVQGKFDAIELSSYMSIGVRYGFDWLDLWVLYYANFMASNKRQREVSLVRILENYFAGLSEEQQSKGLLKRVFGFFGGR